MNWDESALRDLLTASAQHGPPLLDTRQVLVRGRRRLWRNRIAPVVGLILFAALAGGVVVTLPHQRPPGVAESVSVVPGEIETLDVSDMRFGVAARHRDTDRDLFLQVFLPNGRGGWSEVFGGGAMDQPVGPTIFFGNTQFPRVSFATLPAGSTSVTPLFSAETDSQLNTVSVRGIDGQVYVVVAVATATSNDAGRLLGFTWVDDQGRTQRYTPLSG